MTDKTDTQTALAAGIALAKPFEIQGVPAVLVPENATVKTFESLLPAPLRTTQQVQVRSTEHFIAYFNRFASDNSTIYATVDSAKFKGVIDHHGNGLTDNSDHSVVYTCPETEEWQNWKKNSGEWMTQTAFAEFLQDHHLQIIKPTAEQFEPDELDVVFEKLPNGARMIEVAKTLEVNSKSAITSGQNLHNGSLKFEYNEDITGTAGGANGSFEIPIYFVIGVELFKDGKGYLILCRLKYRKQGPELKLQYELIRPNKTHEAAVKDVIEHIRTGKTDPETGEIIDSSGMEKGYLYEVV